LHVPTLYREGLGRIALLVDGTDRAAPYGDAAVRFKIRDLGGFFATHYVVAPTDDPNGRAAQDLAEAAYLAELGADAVNAGTLVTIALPD
jgi:hypothetical protein